MDVDANRFSPAVFYGRRHYTDEESNTLVNFLNCDRANVNTNDPGILHLLHKHLEIARSYPVYVSPPFGEEFQWINTARPLSFDYDLGKKIYVMDFFTYCCINCIHILPLLKAVENEHATNPGFVIIGVHSPKFPNEKDIQRVSEAVIRHEIKHPVIHDYNCVLWKKFGICCWPTVFIVGPLNKLLFILIGELQIEKLQFLCNIVVQHYKTCGEELDLNYIPRALRTITESDTGLLYPGGVSTNSELILVSSTGRNRLVLMNKDLDHILDVIGSGKVGCDDGPFDKASFNAPHGTAWYGKIVFVADTGNHAIRKIDFLSKQVTTIFQKGRLGCCSAEELGPATFPRSGLFMSPWDVCIAPEMGSDLKKSNVLYIAVSGSHQIWAINLSNDEGICLPFAGSGREENKKNTYRFQAGFAQPSGIAYSEIIPEYLFVADCESSTIRSISLINGAVDTLVGGTIDPKDLFAFGDEDGKGYKVRMQHPMSVCVIHENFLAVADTYNHKIKFVHVRKRWVTTLTKGMKLCEPSSVCLLDDNLLVADTNNHKVQAIHLERKHISEHLFRPLQEIECYSLAKGESYLVDIDLKYGGKIRCFFNLVDLNYFPSVPDQRWEVKFKGEERFDIACNSCQLFNNELTFPSITFTAEAFDLMKGYNEDAKPTEIKIIVHSSFCDSVHKVCIYKDLSFRVLVKITESGCRNVNLHCICKV